MIRRLLSSRTSITRLIVALSLYGILVCTTALVSSVQAREVNELGPERDGGVPNWNPDFGGDDDQPTFRPEPSRRMIAAVSEGSFSGTGGQHLQPEVSFFTSVKTFVIQRARYFRVKFNLDR